LILVNNNIKRPQPIFCGNTSDETFDGVKINFTRFSAHFAAHKAFRIAQNKQLFNSSQGKNSCKVCVEIKRKRIKLKEKFKLINSPLFKF